jgi:hypothetical protein
VASGQTQAVTQFCRKQACRAIVPVRRDPRAVTECRPTCIEGRHRVVFGFLVASYEKGHSQLGGVLCFFMWSRHGSRKTLPYRRVRSWRVFLNMFRE